MQEQGLLVGLAGLDVCMVGREENVRRQVEEGLPIDAREGSRAPTMKGFHRRLGSGSLRSRSSEPMQGCGSDDETQLNPEPA